MFIYHDNLEICSILKDVKTKDVGRVKKKNSSMIILFEGIHGPYPMQYAKSFGYPNPLI